MADDISVVEVVNANTTVVESPDSVVVVEGSTSERIVTENTSYTILEIGIQGPPGPGGGGTVAQDYDTRSEVNDAQTVVYRGRAAIGSSDTDNVWQVAKIVVSYNGTVQSQ